MTNEQVEAVAKGALSKVQRTVWNRVDARNGTAADVKAVNKALAKLLTN